MRPLLLGASLCTALLLALLGPRSALALPALVPCEAAARAGRRGLCSSSAGSPKPLSLRGSNYIRLGGNPPLPCRTQHLRRGGLQPHALQRSLRGHAAAGVQRPAGLHRRAARLRHQWQRHLDRAARPALSGPPRTGERWRLLLLRLALLGRF